MSGLETQKADPALRVKTLCLAFFVLVFGAAISYFLENYLSSVSNDIDLLVSRTRHAVYALGLAALPAVYLAFYLLQLARKTIRGDRFPPLGVAVIRDTPIRTGRAARLRGYMLAILALILGLSCMLAPVLMSIIIESFVSQG